MSDIVSKPYRPAMACPRCVFGGPQHADWCEWRVRFVQGGSNWSDFINPEEWRDQINEAKRQWAESTREVPAVITNLGEPK